MSRYVSLRVSGVAATSNEPPDGFGARLAKYVPSEVISIYTITVAGLVSAKPDAANAQWIAVGLMALFCLATIVFFAKNAPAGKVRNAHMLASPIAFVALGYPLAAPLLGAWFIGYIAILGQGIAALAAWLVAPEK